MTLEAFVGTSEQTSLRAGGREGEVKGGGSGERDTVHPAP